MYYVYIYTLPNGKIYVGQTGKPNERWEPKRYVNNTELVNDINIYGWDKVKHEVVYTCESEVEARIYEALLIYMLNSESESIGYNRTKYKKRVEQLYSERVPVDKVTLNNSFGEKNVLESTGLPISACSMLIDQWIFNERYRCIVKDRYLNGLQYQELSTKYNLSVRQLKNIVAYCKDAIESHLNT